MPPPPPPPKEKSWRMMRMRKLLMGSGEIVSRQNMADIPTHNQNICVTLEKMNASTMK